jgi:hypothetical protein
MDKINAAEAAIKQGEADLADAIAAEFKPGLAVKVKGLRDDIDCTVSGYGERGVLILTITKTGKTMNRHYSNTRRA